MQNNQIENARLQAEMESKNKEMMQHNTQSSMP